MFHPRPNIRQTLGDDTHRHTLRPNFFSSFSFTRDMVSGISADLGVDPALRGYRFRAWEDYTHLPMPTTRDEAWRRTDLRALRAGSFVLARGDAADNLTGMPDPLRQPIVGDQHGGQLILQQGKVELSIDSKLTEKGVIFTDLATAAKQYPDQLASMIGQIVHTNEGRFAALAASLAKTGVFVSIPCGVQVEDPLHSVFWAPGSGKAYFTHFLVWLEEGASLTYVHESASPDGTDDQTLHAGIIEIEVKRGASLRFVELQSFGKNVWNFTHERARVGKDANLDWIFGALGSHVTKNFSDLDLVAEGAIGRMSGFYLTLREIKRSLPAELHNDALRADVYDDIHDVLKVTGSKKRRSDVS